jgi:serine/threonine protein kinase
LRHDKLTASSNIYSFGVMVYEMVSGRIPFSIEQIKAAVHKNRSLSFDGTPLPFGLAEILQRCVAADPAQREGAIRTVGESLICWYNRQQYNNALEEHVKTYKDFLMMIWADGKITEEEAAFLAHKRQELHISDDVAEQAEIEIKQELQQLIKKA